MFNLCYPGIIKLVRVEGVSTNVVRALADIVVAKL